MQLRRLHQEGHVASARSSASRGPSAAGAGWARAAVLASLAGGLGCSEAPRAVAVALGAAHTCALDEDGDVWCWGDGALSPTRIEGLPPAQAIAAGDGHSAALGRDGTVWSWGRGDRGQLGNGRTDDGGPVPVVGLTDAVAVAAGDLHGCAILEDRTVWCWGDNATGQLGGTPTEEPQVVAAPVIGVAAHELDAGGLEGVSRTCVVDGERVSCWGRLELTPAEVGLSPAVAVGVGVDHVCAVAPRGQLSCVGTYPEAAVMALADVTFRAVAVGGLHACGLTSAGAVHCFGDDLEGQLGDGPGDSSGRAVRAIERGAVALDVGALHSCAVLDDGRVQCWGENNNGRLGLGRAGGVEASPTTVPGFGD